MLPFSTVPFSVHRDDFGLAKAKRGRRVEEKDANALVPLS